MSDVAIDARGMRCPWPAIRLARALRESSRPITISADDPAAEREMSAVTRAAGWTLSRVDAVTFRAEPAVPINSIFTDEA